MSDNQIIEKASDHVGGGATGASYAADATGSTATLPNSKSQGDTASKKLDGEEQKADASNNTAPTGDASGKNKASIATKPSAASASMKEEIEQIFGADVAEEFKEKATVIFEAAVAAKVADIKEQVEAEKIEYKQTLDTQYADTFAKQKDDFISEMTEQVDGYLDYVVQEWVKENEVAIESTLRAEIAEEFMQKLKNLFVESYIDVPEEKVDLVAEMAAQIEELETKLNTVVSENIDLKTAVSQNKKEDIFDQVSEGLALTQVEKFRKLAEGVDYDEPENYRKKLDIVKEQYFGEKAVVTKTIEEQEIVELDEEAVPVAKVAGPIANYVSAISRTIKK